MKFRILDGILDNNERKSLLSFYNDYLLKARGIGVKEKTTVHDTVESVLKHQRERLYTVKPDENFANDRHSYLEILGWYAAAYQVLSDQVIVYNEIKNKAEGQGDTKLKNEMTRKVLISSAQAAFFEKRFELVLSAIGRD